MNHKLKTLVLFLLISVAGLCSFAQTDEANMEIDNSKDGKGWIFGLNVGVYYPSKNTAAYYNGKSNNENNVNYVMSNYYWYQDIFHALGAHDSISVAGLPDNMHYKLAMQPGLYAQYCFNSTFALMIEFNYMKLKANDVITFDVDPPLDYLGEHQLVLCPMRGIEERVYADIGVKRTYPKTNKLSYYLMGGINVNSTEVKKCSFYVDEVEYNMVNVYQNGGYVPNSNSQAYNVYQGGIGVGGFGGGGVALTFANSIVIETGFTAHWLMVKLEGYQNMNPGIGAYIRFMY
jgi:hypothetical protein